MNENTRHGGHVESMIESTRQVQNTLHLALSRYVNGSIFSRSDALRATITPTQVFRRHSGDIIRKFNAYRECFTLPRKPKINVNVEVYEGKNPHVYKMMDYLQRNLEHDVIGAYVHGSLGTYEEITYSDFDALVILKTDVFESQERLTRVCEKLCRAKGIMYEFDPLQHHGWFVLTELDLPFHCETYFPSELFRHAKLLIGEAGRCLSISPRESGREMQEMLDTLANSVIQKIDHHQYPQNVYRLKNLTSEFMLLPALYVQRKTGTSVFKKFSFEEASRDFDPGIWYIMDEVSKLRQEWGGYHLQSWQRRIACSRHVLRNYLVELWAPEIPKKIKVRLSHEFFASMRQLALLMRERFLSSEK